jgi:tricarballylate dehydrogenase
MRQHGVNFQPPLSGALHVARTNAFFMGGGKALVNAYYRSAEQMGVQIRYNTPVQASNCATANLSPRWRARNGLSRKAASSPPADLNPTASGCARPGAK